MIIHNFSQFLTNMIINDILIKLMSPNSIDSQISLSKNPNVKTILITQINPLSTNSFQEKPTLNNLSTSKTKKLSIGSLLFVGLKITH